MNKEKMISIISAVVTDAFSPEGFLFVVNGRLVGGRHLSVLCLCVDDNLPFGAIIELTNC